jgi:hypothetical protein
MAVACQGFCFEEFFETPTTTTTTTTTTTNFFGKTV